MLTVLALVGTIGLLSLFLSEVLKKRKYQAIVRNYGGPSGIPFVGVLFQSFRLKDFAYDWPKFIRNTASKSAFVWFLRFPTFYTKNPDFAEKIFLSPDCIVKNDMYSVLNRDVGAGIITLGGDEWTRHRKLLNPSFNYRILKTFLPIFNEKSFNFIRELESLVGRGEVQLHNYLQKFTIKITFATLLDVDFKDGDERSTKFMKHIDRFRDVLMERIVTVPWRSDIIFRLSRSYKLYKESRAFVLDFVRDLINDKMKSMNCHKSLDTEKGNKKFIDLALDLYRNGIFSWDEVYFEALTLVFASFDTSANTMYSILLHLAMHPQYQEKLFAEVVDLYPEKDFTVKYEDLMQLTYMDMVINETMRVAAIVPLIGRVVTKDLNLAEDLVLPPETSVLIDIFNMHRDQDIWGPDADKFNPDHFVPENLKGKHRNCFTPFAKGPRICIGWRYADLFLKSSLAKIIRNFRFTTKFQYEDLRYGVTTTLKYEIAPTLVIHRR